MQLARLLSAFILVLSINIVCASNQFTTHTKVAVQKDVVIKAGRLLDPETGKVSLNQHIHIQNQKIIKISTKRPLAESAEFIDLSGSTVFPGLMDAHTHLCWHINQRYNDGYVMSIVRQPTPYRAIQGVMNAKDMLLTGFTTVRDVGNAANYADSALRMAIEDGLVIGPTVINAGRIISPFGGQRWVIPERPDFTQPEYFFADTRDEIKKAIRENIHYGAKVIKLVVDDQKYIYSEEDIRFAVQEAAAAGLKVAAHCQSERGAINAIKAGVATVEHNASKAIIALAKKKGVWLVNTPFSLPALESMRTDMRWGTPESAYKKNVKELKQAYAAGAPIAFGADIISKLKGHNRGQATLTLIQTFVDAGVSPLQILRAMTINAAQAIDVDKERGYIKTGYYADIIATHENPLQNINVLKNVHFVMKQGVVYKFESNQK